MNKELLSYNDATIIGLLMFAIVSMSVAIVYLWKVNEKRNDEIKELAEKYFLVTSGIKESLVTVKDTINILLNR